MQLQPRMNPAAVAICSSTEWCIPSDPLPKAEIEKRCKRIHVCQSAPLGPPLSPSIQQTLPTF
jgi:hypothetical protein